MAYLERLDNLITGYNSFMFHGMHIGMSHRAKSAVKVGRI